VDRSTVQPGGRGKVTARLAVEDAGMDKLLTRVLGGAVAALTAAALLAVPGAAPGLAAGCVRTVTTDPEVTAAEGAGDLTLRVYSTGCPAAGQVAYALGPGTARAPEDFIAASGLLRFTAGDRTTREIRVPIVDDAIAEPSLEGFELRLNSDSQDVGIVGAPGRGRILDNDGPGPVFAADDHVCRPDTAGCSCGWGFDNIYCPPGGHTSTSSVTAGVVHWHTVAGTALAGVDFVGVPDGVSLVPAGATRFELPVTVMPRPSGTGQLWFAIELTDTAAGTIVDGYAVVTITGG
jgi:hypothetical protein